VGPALIQSRAWGRCPFLFDLTNGQARAVAAAFASGRCQLLQLLVVGPPTSLSHLRYRARNRGHPARSVWVTVPVAEDFHAILSSLALYRMKYRSHCGRSYNEPARTSFWP
jgi:hypothetical protein